MYIIMMRDECGDERRITDFDKTHRGFETECAAYRALPAARYAYPEARSIWIEPIKCRQCSDEADALNDFNNWQEF